MIMWVPSFPPSPPLVLHPSAPTHTVPQPHSASTTQCVTHTLHPNNETRPHLQHVAVNVDRHVGEVACCLQQLARQATATNQGSPECDKDDNDDNDDDDDNATGTTQHNRMGQWATTGLSVDAPYLEYPGGGLSLTNCLISFHAHRHTYTHITHPVATPYNTPYIPVLQQAHQESPRVLGRHVPVTPQVGQHKQHQALGCRPVTVLAQPALDPVGEVWVGNVGDVWVMCWCGCSVYCG